MRDVPTAKVTLIIIIIIIIVVVVVVVVAIVDIHPGTPPYVCNLPSAANRVCTIIPHSAMRKACST
jgi:hypothetical protein